MEKLSQEIKVLPGDAWVGRHTNESRLLSERGHNLETRTPETAQLTVAICKDKNTKKNYILRLQNIMNLLHNLVQIGANGGSVTGNDENGQHDIVMLNNIWVVPVVHQHFVVLSLLNRIWRKRIGKMIKGKLDFILLLPNSRKTTFAIFV